MTVVNMLDFGFESRYKLGIPIYTIMSHKLSVGSIMSVVPTSV